MLQRHGRLLGFRPLSYYCTSCNTETIWSQELPLTMWEEQCRDCLQDWLFVQSGRSMALMLAVSLLLMSLLKDESGAILYLSFQF